MSEIIYSKKQINPLVEKYKINVEKNMVFQSLITMFRDQPNYQIWAIKTVFENVASLDVIQRIKSWAENNQTEIKNLTKGNIILYKKPEDFKMLEDEMRGLEMLKFVNESINKFNTNQRKMLKNEILKNINNALEALASRKFIEWFEIFRQMSTLVRHRQEKLISTSSAINDDIHFLKEHIKSALAESYDWNKEDMLGFMARNASDCSVVHNEGDIVVITVPSFKSSKLMCGNGRTGWCLTREERYFNQYVKEQRDATQYFVFDFSKKESHELAHIGFTVQAARGITNAHSTRNNNLMGNVNVDGKSVNIHKALQDAKIPSSVYIHLKDLKNYKWDVEAFLKFVEKNKKNIAISVAENNRFVVRVLTNDAFNGIIDHSLIDYRNYSINNNTKTYVFLDFNLKKDDDKSLMVIHYSKDQYNFDTLNSVKNAYNVECKKENHLANLGITTDMYLNREKIDPTILLHKLIDEGSEKEAIDLIMNEGENFDVNFEFNSYSPIFKSINAKMYNLFNTIINHKKFDASTADGFGEALLQSLIYSYGVEDNAENKSIKKMIETVLESETYDFNALNLNLDTAANVCVEEPHRLWILERLLSKPNVNVNIANDFNCTLIGNAIRFKNIEALKLIGQRPDVVVREEDKEMAKEYGIDLAKFINPKPFATHTVEQVKGDNTISELSEFFAKVLSSKK